VGPACRDPVVLRRLIQAGTDVVRLNTAHGSFDEFAQVITAVRACEAELGPLGVLLDLAGPKIRLGTLATDPMHCEIGQTIRLIPGDAATDAQSITCNCPQLLDELEPGNRVVLADGQVTLEVTVRLPGEVQFRVVAAGSIRSRQGINLPGAKLGMPALTDADRRWLEWPGVNQVDYISLSFVRQAEDILQLRSLLQESGHSVPIVAKLEKPEALTNLDAIVEVADAVMVARGDLGVEIDVAEVPLAQKRIIATCNRKLKPVIVATQMLDSMQHAPRPTRAETTDVANAVLDGADACMLSGETAVGEYPIESVQTMNRILTATESLLRQRDPRSQAAHQQAHPVTHAVIAAAGRIAAELNARLMVVVTRSGITALTKSSLRDFVPTIAVCGDLRVLRRMTLWWGITPVALAPVTDRQELRDFAENWGKVEGLLTAGDLFLLVSGTRLFPDVHNQLSVYVAD
jgi:pyruvate kinase